MKVKKANYQTPGYITRDNIRSKFNNYHSVTVNMNPSIKIPDPGLYPISLEIGNSRHSAIASVTEPISLKEKENRRIRAYITDLRKEIKDEKVLISWQNPPKSISNQAYHDELGKVVSL
ncbi:hypothetical protein [Oceanobacillus chungangensis]|uniref:Uncharacterized protein n=1 Tax=Oceanobacillus chungangensis TaxID=1229152 RepID=A0A3D8PN58_9BACI|nr:hypothetical protein [Oceanobacillus chungangensis]RDW16689.1 hypothetical protein CWR45_13745 [Oceanobacillus chungangensis]